MINASPSLELAEALGGCALATYLVKNGWSERPSKIEGISILSKQLAVQPKLLNLYFRLFVASWTKLAA